MLMEMFEAEPPAIDDSPAAAKEDHKSIEELLSTLAPQGGRVSGEGLGSPLGILRLPSRALEAFTYH